MRRVTGLLTISAPIALGLLAMAHAASDPVPVLSQQPTIAGESEVFRLWPGRAPGATDDSTAQTPTLTVVRPQPGWSNGTAIVIAPGGGYLGLARALEGTQPAAWFASRGVTAFVLTYRVGAIARLPIPLQDGARAMRWVRAHAAEFRIDPARIGMMGFSAGGHLAASTAVDATAGQTDAADPVEQASSRPDFLVLAYPWLEATQLDAKGKSAYCDFASRLAGANCNSRDYTGFFPLQQVTANTPPTFIYHTTNDETVPVEGSVRFYMALRSHQVAAELHAFEAGRHGSGLGGSNPALAYWPALLQEWMRSRALLPAPRAGEGRQ